MANLRAGLIGLGMMGRPMATNLLSKGVKTWLPSPIRVATSTASPADVRC